MTNNINILPAELSDIPQIHGIYSHYVKNTIVNLDEKVPTLAKMQQSFKNISKAGLPYIVAKDGDKVVGYCYAAHYRTRLAYRYSVEISIYIHPDYRGKSVGKNLLTEVIKQAKAKGMKQMLAVVVNVPESSKKFHESFGFREVGKLENVGFKFDRWVDTLFMQLSL
jgi:phosphinothricin acetyltransferase